MKAWTLDDFGASPALREDLPEPDGDDIVSVKATSVNPVDGWVVAGVLKQFAEYRFPVILGRDFAGVTAAGEEVFGFVSPVGGDGVHSGAWAERIDPGAFVAPKPASLSMAEAGAAGLAGTMALLYVESLGLQGGERVLIVGANGGAGAFAIQLCVAAGATVVAPALEIDEAYLKGLGVSEVVPRGKSPEADAVIDLLAPPQTLNATSDPTAVARLGDLIDQHAIRVPICEGFSFGEIPAALSALREHKQGKLSVV